MSMSNVDRSCELAEALNQSECENLHNHFTVCLQDREEQGKADCSGNPFDCISPAQLCQDINKVRSSYS